MVEAEKAVHSVKSLYSLNVQGPVPDAEEDHITVYAGDLTTISILCLTLKKNTEEFQLPSFPRVNTLSCMHSQPSVAVQATKVVTGCRSWI